jgi:predicted transcriptional regulator
MIRFLVQLDDETARALERFAPAAAHARSRFIRLAIRRAPMEEQDRVTRLAYARAPDDEPAHFDAGAWEPASIKRGLRSRRAKAKPRART